LRKVEQRSRIWPGKFGWSCLYLEEEEVEREKKKAGDADRGNAFASLLLETELRE
jgi:hypothetical protein